MTGAAAEAAHGVFGAIGVVVVVAALVRAVVSDKSWRDRARPRFLLVVLTLAVLAVILSLAAQRPPGSG
jgi:hypothetical protein